MRPTTRRPSPWTNTTCSSAIQVVVTTTRRTYPKGRRLEEVDVLFDVARTVGGHVRRDPPAVSQLDVTVEWNDSGSAARRCERRANAGFIVGLDPHAGRRAWCEVSNRV